MKKILIPIETPVQKIKCKNCGKIFELKKKTRYFRKYCDKCSKENKEYYENLSSLTPKDCED